MLGIQALGIQAGNHCLYPHHAECIETQSVLIYPGTILHDCKKKGKRGFLSKTPLNSMFNKH